MEIYTFMPYYYATVDSIPSETPSVTTGYPMLHGTIDNDWGRGTLMKLLIVVSNN